MVDTTQRTMVNQSKLQRNYLRRVHSESSFLRFNDDDIDSLYTKANRSGENNHLQTKKKGVYFLAQLSSSTKFITTQTLLLNQCKSHLRCAKQVPSFSMFSTSVDLNSKSVESFLSDSISTQSRFLFHFKRGTELQHITFPSVPVGDLQLFVIQLSE